MTKNKLLLLPLALVMAIPLAGCEADGTQTTKDRAHQVIRAADSVCAKRGKTASLLGMDSVSDDVIITCGDGSNHYYDG